MAFSKRTVDLYSIQYISLAKRGLGLGWPSVLLVEETGEYH